MTTETRYHRQLDLEPLDRLQKARVTIIGCGAVGSFTAFTLAKMGVGRICVYDDDRVEEHNIPNQLFAVGDCGRLKVEALRDMVLRFHGVDVEACPVRYVDQPLSGIVVVAVDAMDARLAIWEQVRYRIGIDLFIDSRMGAEVGKVMAIRPADVGDVEWYESTLHTSREALPERCTEKAIIYTVLGIAAAVCGKIKKHLAGQWYHRSQVLDFRQSIMIAQ